MSVETDITGCILSTTCTDSPSEHGHRTRRHIITAARSADRIDAVESHLRSCVSRRLGGPTAEAAIRSKFTRAGVRSRFDGGASMLFTIGWVCSIKACRTEMDRRGLG